MPQAATNETGLIEALDGYIDDHAADVVELTQAMVRYNTVSVDLSPDSEHRTNDEGALQAMMGDRLAALGATIDQWEPDPAALHDHPMMPPWHHWKGRPQTVATFKGAGGGRSLIINGHIDVVHEGDHSQWDADPFGAELRDGRIYGRGSVDMKGGLAAAYFALQALHANEVRLAGDVFYEVVTDEETCAMGTIAAIERGYRADAGLVPEPTELGMWIVTRGLLHGVLTIPGRSAHAEINQPSWHEGGGVNAIERALPLLAALGRLKENWRERPSKRHAMVGVPAVQPTVIHGGSFIANVPERVRVEVNATYLPADADHDGYGTVPRGEIVDAIASAAAADDWFREHPPTWSWSTDYPPSEIAADEQIIAVALQAARDVGGTHGPVGIDTTYDGALLTLFARTPSPAFGPGNLSRAHAPNEWIGVDELVQAAKAYARAVTRWCGVR
jgi:acetylornithine deacetylase